MADIVSESPMQKVAGPDRVKAVSGSDCTVTDTACDTALHGVALVTVTV